eukprot:TRINITY_DN9440_c0_g1_i1.p1 TRINITY_DN9440_c0_g1~~TRINITY_DN9440_c0_g1_i1.p1  ORF type:complete len:217 (-),score=52.42 TRINITY_DN9440_c0_g1_i1:74-724(-)
MGNQEGHGKFIWDNGDIYEGGYKNDLRDGIGTFTWYNNNVYTGEWKEGRRTGVGRFTWSNGDVHEGKWFDSRMTGEGSLTWCNGNCYKGGWRDGEKTEGVLFEAPTKREFPVNLTSDIYEPSYLHTSIQQCISKKMCTFNATGEKSYFQYLWKTQQHKDGRTRGVCVTCYESCVQKNKITLLEPLKCLFGGNFFCDCGGGFLPLPCLCISTKHSKT